MHKNFKTALLLSTAVFLSACKLDDLSGLTGQTAEAKIEVGLVAESPEEYVVVGGQVTAGYAECNINVLDEDGNSLLINPARSNAWGEFSVSILDSAGYKSLVATDCSFIDETTGEQVTGRTMRSFLMWTDVEPTRTLRGLPPVNDGLDRVVSVQVTPFTELAYRVAERSEATDGGDFGDHLAAADDQMRSLLEPLGFDYRNTVPVVATDDVASTSSEQEKAHGIALAALSGTGDLDAVLNMIEAAVTEDMDALGDTIIETLTIGSAEFEVSGNNATGDVATNVVAGLRRTESAGGMAPVATTQTIQISVMVGDTLRYEIPWDTLFSDPDNVASELEFDVLRAVCGQSQRERDVLEAVCMMPGEETFFLTATDPNGNAETVEGLLTIIPRSDVSDESQTDDDQPQETDDNTDLTQEDSGPNDSGPGDSGPDDAAGTGIVVTNPDEDGSNDTEEEPGSEEPEEPVEEEPAQDDDADGTEEEPGSEEPEEPVEEEPAQDDDADGTEEEPGSEEPEEPVEEEPAPDSDADDTEEDPGSEEPEERVEEEPAQDEDADESVQELTRVDAVRFLTQAAYGATEDDISGVIQLSYDGWISEQMSLEPIWWVDRLNYASTLQTNYRWDLYTLFWEGAIDGEDQLRQRIAFALSQIFANNTISDIHHAKPQMHGAFWDLFQEHAFGTYEELLYDVSMNASMGLFLTHLGNKKADEEAGTVPDENYAREVMQLFTIGVVDLNDLGEPMGTESYNSDDVSGLARVFTGLAYARNDDNSVAYHLPMVGVPDQHETGTKTFLGKGVTATTTEESVREAVSILVNHQNTAPFVSKILIQRLVTANPTPAYVGRVATAFRTGTYLTPNGQSVGSGEVGDLAATITAILLDSEARDSTFSSATTFGKVRGPVLRKAQLTRTFREPTVRVVESELPEFRAWWADDGMGQTPLRSPSVFNFFRPGYVHSDGFTAAQNLVSPEMQIATPSTMTEYLKMMAELITGPTYSFFDLDLSAPIALAEQSDDLIDYLDELLVYGTMTSEVRQRIQSGLLAIPVEGLDGDDLSEALEMRVQLALLILTASPEYISQN